MPEIANERAQSKAVVKAREAKFEECRLEELKELPPSGVLIYTRFLSLYTQKLVDLQFDL